MYLATMALNICCSFAFFMFNNLELLEWFIVLSNRDDRMNIVNLLNPTPSAGNTGGGSGGGPPNTQIVVPQHQGDNRPDQDNPNPINPVVNDLNNNPSLADRLKASTDAVLESRRQAIENTPNIHGGRRARITEIVTLRDVHITRQEKVILRNLVARDD